MALDDTQIIIETVRAVVQAYGEGRITLEPVSKDAAKNRTRSAPSFLLEDKLQNNLSPYTNDTLAKFLGWLQPSGKPQQKRPPSLSHESSLSFVVCLLPCHVIPPLSFKRC